MGGDTGVGVDVGFVGTAGGGGGAEGGAVMFVPPWHMHGCALHKIQRLRFGSFVTWSLFTSCVFQAIINALVIVTNSEYCAFSCIPDREAVSAKSGFS